MCLHIPDNSVCPVTLRGLFGCQTEVAGFCSGETALLDFVLERGKYFSTFLFLIIQIIPLVLQQGQVLMDAQPGESQMWLLI